MADGRRRALEGVGAPEDLVDDLGRPLAPLEIEEASDRKSVV
jgi:hypothetical protein